MHVSELNNVALVFFGAASLLTIASSQELGVNLCFCQPDTITFKLDFSFECPGSNVAGPGINDTACLVETRDSIDAITDFAPTFVSEVQVLELDQNLQIVGQSFQNGPFFNGDEITYTSIVMQSPETVMASPELLPRGFQVSITGLNANEESLVNTWVVRYTNDCGIFPLLEIGDRIGWSEFVSSHGPSSLGTQLIQSHSLPQTELGIPGSDFCPIAHQPPGSTIPPVTAPTVSPSESPSDSPSDSPVGAPVEVPTPPVETEEPPVVVETEDPPVDVPVSPPVLSSTPTVNICVATSEESATLSFNELAAGALLSSTFGGFDFMASSCMYPMVFDTANPTGGDTDLVTPNSDKILIVSEDCDATDPDDREGGGIITFMPSEFEAFQVSSICLTDVVGGSIIGTSVNGDFHTQAIPDLGDAGYECVGIDFSDVSLVELSIEMSDSGGVHNIAYTPSECEEMSCPSMSGKAGKGGKSGKGGKAGKGKVPEEAMTESLSEKGGKAGKAGKGASGSGKAGKGNSGKSGSQGLDGIRRRFLQEECYGKGKAGKSGSGKSGSGKSGSGKSGSGKSGSGKSGKGTTGVASGKGGLSGKGGVEASKAGMSGKGTSSDAATSGKAGKGTSTDGAAGKGSGKGERLRR